MNESGLILLNPRDNVAVARVEIAEGQAFSELGITSRQSIPCGHKIALADIPAGKVVVKYGQIIGVASNPIQAGDHIHLHNLVMAEGRLAAETSKPSDVRNG